MKKLRNVLFILLSSILLFSCEYDDADLWSEIDHIKTELTQINKQVASVESLVEALNKGKIITQVDQLAEGNGYVITFNDGSKIEVVNGENAPVIGIKNVDGVYYWTIETNGIVEFLLDSDNNKLRVSGEDGNTPALAVDDQGYWTLNGERIIDGNGQPVKAVGSDGDSFFTKITETDDSVIFELADGTTIEIPKQLETSLVFESPEDNSSYFFFNFEEEKELKLKTANIVSAEIVEQPKGWSI
ncbi:MAG TPA: PL29 family lyase N-terminal domain-containing protein, partial [Atopostipes sp.]|nr:PL29 family lyase N-terminal domain-containing protein [Atopostipes sp.]